MRILLVLAAAMLAAAGAASAQVAAPLLNPMPVARLNAKPAIVATAQNPALLSWDGPPRVAASYSNVDFDDASTATVNPDATGKVTAVLVRLVGERFAFGAESQKVRLDPVGAGSSIELGAQSAGASVQFGDWISVGIGRHVETYKEFGVDQRETLSLAGVGARFGGVYYVAAVRFNADVKDQIAPAETSRPGTAYGIAFHTRDQEHGVHLEAYHTERAEVVDPMLSVDELKTNGYAAEVVWWNLLFGIVGHDSKRLTTTGNGSEARQAAVSVGYVPAQGLALVATLSKQEFSDAATGAEDASVEIKSLGLSWMF